MQNTQASQVLPVLNDTFAPLLARIVDDPAKEIEWLDMLSQLEFVGCRKILKSQTFERMNAKVLRHLSEEASHAYLLRAIVEQWEPSRGSWPRGKWSAAGWNYFQTLDAKVAELVGEKAAYPAVSWVIERRVLWVYPLYLELTRKDEVCRAVKRILAQEVQHANQFEDTGPTEERKALCIAIEEKLWEDLQKELERGL